MIFPMILGYIVGAAGAYTLLFRKAPVIEEEFFEGKDVTGMPGEVVELFPQTGTDSSEIVAERKVA